MMNTKKYISAVEAISLLAYSETERLSKILDLSTNYYKKWAYEPKNLLASFQRLIKGNESKEKTDVYVASLVTKLKKTPQELRNEFKQDMRVLRKYPCERIVKAHDNFIEAIRSEQLPIYGKRQGETGDVKKISEEFTRRRDYGINILGTPENRNAFCFKPEEGQSISKDTVEEADAVYKWKGLQILEEDVRNLVTGERVPQVLLAEKQESRATVNDIAEWIFQRYLSNHGVCDNKGTIYSAALSESSGLKFTQEDFDTAYRTVFVTKRGKRPAQGWQLQPQYVLRYQQNCEKKCPDDIQDNKDKK